MDDDAIEIPRIGLRWSRWYGWHDLELDSRVRNSGVRVPNKSGFTRQDVRTNMNAWP